MKQAAVGPALPAPSRGYRPLSKDASGSLDSLAVSLLERMAFVKGQVEQQPGQTFIVVKVNLRGRRQLRALGVTSSALLNMRLRRRMPGVPSIASVAVADHGDLVAAGADPTRFFVSRSMAFSDILETVLEGPGRVLIRLRAYHDMRYESPLAPAIVRAVQVGQARLMELQKLELLFSELGILSGGGPSSGPHLAAGAPDAAGAGGWVIPTAATVAAASTSRKGGSAKARTARGALGREKSRGSALGGGSASAAGDSVDGSGAAGASSGSGNAVGGGRGARRESSQAKFSLATRALPMRLWSAADILDTARSKSSANLRASVLSLASGGGVAAASAGHGFAGAGSAGGSAAYGGGAGAHFGLGNAAGAGLAASGIAGSEGAPLDALGARQRVASWVATEAPTEAEQEAEQVAMLAQTLLYDPLSPEGRTRAKFVASDFGTAVSETVAHLRAASAAAGAVAAEASTAGAAESATAAGSVATAGAGPSTSVPSGITSGSATGASNAAGIIAGSSAHAARGGAEASLLPAASQASPASAAAASSPLEGAASSPGASAAVAGEQRSRSASFAAATSPAAAAARRASRLGVSLSHSIGATGHSGGGSGVDEACMFGPAFSDDDSDASTVDGHDSGGRGAQGAVRALELTPLPSLRSLSTASGAASGRRLVRLVDAAADRVAVLAPAPVPFVSDAAATASAVASVHPRDLLSMDAGHGSSAAAAVSSPNSLPQPLSTPGAAASSPLAGAFPAFPSPALDDRDGRSDVVCVHHPEAADLPLFAALRELNALLTHYVLTRRKEMLGSVRRALPWGTAQSYAEEAAGDAAAAPPVVAPAVEPPPAAPAATADLAGDAAELQRPGASAASTPQAAPNPCIAFDAAAAGPTAVAADVRVASAASDTASGEEAAPAGALPGGAASPLAPISESQPHPPPQQQRRPTTRLSAAARRRATLSAAASRSSLTPTPGVEPPPGLQLCGLRGTGCDAAGALLGRDGSPLREVSDSACSLSSLPAEGAASFAGADHPQVAAAALLPAGAPGRSQAARTSAQWHASAALSSDAALLQCPWYVAKTVTDVAEALVSSLEQPLTVRTVVQREVEASLWNVVSIRRAVSDAVRSILDPSAAAVIADKLAALRAAGATQAFLGIPPALQQADGWAAAVLELRDADRHACPREKMEALLGAVRAVYKGHARKHAAARMAADAEVAAVAMAARVAADATVATAAVPAVPQPTVESSADACTHRGACDGASARVHHSTAASLGPAAGDESAAHAGTGAMMPRSGGGWAAFRAGGATDCNTGSPGAALPHPLPPHTHLHHHMQQPCSARSCPRHKPLLREGEHVERVVRLAEQLPALGADEFLPIFLFVLVHSQLDNAVALNELLWATMDPADLRGHGGYYLTVFEAALEFVRDMALPAAEPSGATGR